MSEYNLEHLTERKQIEETLLFESLCLELSLLTVFVNLVV